MITEEMGLGLLPKIPLVLTTLKEAVDMVE